MIAIGITNDVDDSELKFLSSYPNKEGLNYYKSLDFRKLSETLNQMIEKVCGTKGPTAPTIIIPTVPPAPPECEKAKIDLCFIVDTSASIRKSNPADQSYDNWQTMVEFMKYVVNAIEISPDENRVAAVRFSETAYLEFDLASYTTKSDLLK